MKESTLTNTYLRALKRSIIAFAVTLTFASLSTSSHEICDLDLLARLASKEWSEVHTTVMISTGTQLEFDLPQMYKDVSAKKVLRIADGRGVEADQLASQLTDVQFVSADYSTVFASKLPNVQKLRMDNTLPFPFKDSTFDVIVMKKGICTCYTCSRTCGGITTNVDTVYKFLSEVYRTLNTTNPKARAILHGGYFGEIDDLKKTWSIFEEAMARLEKVQPVNVKILRHTSGVLIGIEITPRLDH